MLLTVDIPTNILMKLNTFLEKNVVYHHSRYSLAVQYILVYNEPRRKKNIKLIKTIKTILILLKYRHTYIVRVSNIGEVSI